MAVEFKTYKTNKYVKAAQILGFTVDGLLSFGPGQNLQKDRNWVDKFHPVVNGYYVEYEDGYSYFSSQNDFDKLYQFHEVAQK